MTEAQGKAQGEARRRRGALAHAAGLMAEEAAARHYEDQGLIVVARRWRSPGGEEVDLILRDGAALIFVEVKHAATQGQAAHRLLRRQMDRLLAAAAAFCASEPWGLLTNMRFDLALVDGLGRVHVIENAFGEGW